MALCPSCGTEADAGGSCSRCGGGGGSGVGVAAGAGGAKLDLGALGKELVLQPAAAVRTLLGQREVVLGAVLLAVALVLQILADLIGWKALYNRWADFPAGRYTVMWLEWVVLQGAWVAGITLTSARCGTRLRWEGVLTAVAALILPGRLLHLLAQSASVPLYYVPSAATYATSLLFYAGLFQIGRIATDGDEGGIYRFLLIAGAYQAGVSVVWNFFEYALR